MLLPLKRRHFKNLPAPWLMSDIRLMMRERNLARRIWRRSGNNHDYDRFKVLQNRTQSMIHTAKRAYYLNIFNDSDRPNVVWSRLRHLGLIKARDFSASLSLSVDELNEFSAGDAVIPEADDHHQSFTEILSGNYIDTSFHWDYVTPPTIKKVLNSAKSNAVGSDGISLRFIKQAIHFILPVLEHLFNYSLMNEVFPAMWRSALICPIPKIKNPTMVQHYRPISILPVLSKALERIVSEQIRCYLKNFTLYDPCQSTYRSCHSTQTCLIQMLDEEVEESELFRICTALVLRLSYVLSQTVKDSVAGTMSSLTLVSEGIFQGSVLGPLLFTLYLSDFRNVLQHCKYNFYADDLQVYLHCKPRELSDAILKVDEDINAVINWSFANGLILNSDKTQAIIFGTSRYVNAIDLYTLPKIMVDMTAIQYSTSVRYLGVIIINNLS
ncbi:reverse transcriptase [Lasius niger]|uniref:Reverse transcriptase n=1 Tax=Lasius niger TaxID=67767 RepID=A0A0J7KTD2_LASNI|nr:reverse transcriptase [Lasius niger]